MAALAGIKRRVRLSCGWWWMPVNDSSEEAIDTSACLPNTLEAAAVTEGLVGDPHSEVSFEGVLDSAHLRAFFRLSSCCCRSCLDQ